VSDIVGELRRGHEAFKKPTLDLLRRKHAPVLLAVFMCSFSRDQDSLPVDEFHVLVESFFGELISSGIGIGSLENEPPRVLCRKWVDDKWLELAADNPDKQERYTLTSHAREAIEYINHLVGDRSVFGESRIRTIIDAARRCAEYANPDRDAKIARLNQQISELTAERDRLLDGGDIEPVSVDRVIEEYLNIREMLEKLPSDFLRLSERVREIQRTIIDEFRQEGRRAGEVLDIYLDRSQELMSDSLEGRAFGGAVELLRDEGLIAQLRRDLNLILEHPFSETLSAAESTDFRNAVTGIRRGITTVLERRRRLSASIKNYVTSHDPLGDRELDNILRRARSELAAWSKTASPRDKVPLDLGLDPLDVGTLQTRFYNPADHAPPRPLADTSTEEASAPTLDELRRAGGPSMAVLRQRVLAKLSEQAAVTAGDLFNDLPGELRRPVEVLGLIQIAASTGSLSASHGQGDDVFDAVRNDRSRRRLKGPRMEFTQHHRSALVAHLNSDEEVPEDD